MEKRRPSIGFWASLHPRHWGVWIMLGIMWLMAQLPHSWQQGLGRRLGRLGYRIGGSRRRMTEANIRACFPERSPQEQDALVLGTFEANAVGMVECTQSWFGSMQRYRRDLQVDGGELLRDNLAKGRGVLLYGGHFSILDFALPLVDAVHPVAYMYRPNASPVLDKVIENRRAPYRHANFSKRELRELIAYLLATEPDWPWHEPLQQKQRTGLNSSPELS